MNKVREIQDMLLSGAQKEQADMKVINADPLWHSWKCSCGCLNRRSNGNCGRCGGMVHPSCHFYGDNKYVNPNGRQ